MNRSDRSGGNGNVFLYKYVFVCAIRDSMGLCTFDTV